MFLLFISIAVVGAILFFLVIVFHTSVSVKKRGTEEQIQPLSGRGAGHPELVKSPREKSPKTIPEGRVISRKGEKTGASSYIPVVRPDRIIPGLNKGELVHYKGSGVLYSIELLVDPQEINPEEHELSVEVEGEVVITSRGILVYDSKNIKKISTSAIEKFDFRGPYVIIKRKNVKKKKDIVKVPENTAEFKYILHTLA